MTQAEARIRINELAKLISDSSFYRVHYINGLQVRERVVETTHIEDRIKELIPIAKQQIEAFKFSQIEGSKYAK